MVTYHLLNGQGKSFKETTFLLVAKVTKSSEAIVTFTIQYPSLPLQYTATGKSLPNVELTGDMCAVCGQRIELPTAEGGKTERTYRLACNHLYPPLPLHEQTGMSMRRVAAEVNNGFLVVAHRCDC